MSPSNSETSHSPPARSVLTSVPLETVGSPPGPPRNDVIVASQVPSSAARISCSAVGFGGSWAIVDVPRIDVTRQRRISDFDVTITTPLQEVGHL